MKPKRKTYVVSAASSAYPWIPLNYQADQSFSLMYNVTKTGTGDSNYSIQGTISNILGGITANAFDLVSAKAASFAPSAAVNTPLTGIRLNVTGTVSGASTLVFEVLEAGIAD